MQPKEAAFTLALLHPSPACRPSVDSLLASDMFCEAAAVLRSMNTTTTPLGASVSLSGDGGRDSGLQLQGPPSSGAMADQQELDEQVRGGKKGGGGEGMTKLDLDAHDSCEWGSAGGDVRGGKGRGREGREELSLSLL